MCQNPSFGFWGLQVSSNLCKVAVRVLLVWMDIMTSLLYLSLLSVMVSANQVKKTGNTAVKFAQLNIP